MQRKRMKDYGYRIDISQKPYSELYERYKKYKCFECGAKMESEVTSDD